MKLNIKEIIKATGAEIIKTAREDVPLTTDTEYGFSTDTRTVKPEDIYIPLKGEKFDGENFIVSALASGCKGYFTSDKTKIYDNAGVILYTEDTKEAYLKLAGFYKSKLNPYTVMITGSSGKTTVKEMMSSVFSSAGKTVKSLLNHNNEIGFCQTASMIANDTKYLIVEAGMRGPGEIELISEYATPDIGVIVNAGSAHIGRLGSLLNIAKAKFEIAKYLKPEGVLISHDNELIRQINDNVHKTIYFSLNSPELTIKEMTSEICVFDYKGNEYKLNVPGEHNVQNALSVIEAACFAGLNYDTIRKGLEEYAPIEKRWDEENIGPLKIINDGYNSNPDSLKAAIKTFLEYTKGIKVLVLGDMGELGDDEEKYHKETGDFIEQFDCDCLLTIGELSKSIRPKNVKTVHLETKTEIAAYLAENYSEGANILLKASRFMKFEEITEELRKRYGI